MGRIVLETDSSILACAVQGTDYDLSPEGVIFRDIRASLRLNFISVKVAHVPHQEMPQCYIFLLKGKQTNVSYTSINRVPAYITKQ
jgi:hypothetical protein